jgi:hypothetical protein
MSDQTHSPAYLDQPYKDWDVLDCMDSDYFFDLCDLYLDILMHEMGWEE